MVRARVFRDKDTNRNQTRKMDICHKKERYLKMDSHKKKKDRLAETDRESVRQTDR